MAASAVSGAFLSGFANVVLERLLSPEVANFIRGKKLHQDLVDRLKTALRAVQVVLNDAELKQINDPSVQDWLFDLRDAFYVADDLLDRLFTQAAPHKEVTTTNLFSRFLNLRDRKVVPEIEAITSRLENIVKYKDTLSLKDIPNEDFSWRTPSTSLLLPSPSCILGRDHDKVNIVNLLSSEDPNTTTEDPVSVIPIWGMGGVGKTTLAQWLYNDDTLVGHFDRKIWVCVSEESNIINITKSVLRELTSAACDDKELNLLQLDLKEKLTGKKFFLVLDDVWNLDRHAWNRFKRPFQYGIKGSKILVTTRSEKIASTVQTIPPYLLSELSDEYCWSLFAKHAHFQESGGDSNMEKIGRDIVKKCRGLPLAAETLGGLLQTKNDIRSWNAILRSEIWEIDVEDSKIIPALKVSYYHLPPHLKRCFGYCSLFPKYYIFHKDVLVLLWMAEDLLRAPKKGETLEEVGSECFDDLTSRSFFKRFNNPPYESFVMHNLMHDLAIFVTGDFYCRLEELGKANNIKSQTRHLSFGKLSYPLRHNVDVIDKLQSLRTFLPIRFRAPLFSYKNIVQIILSKLGHSRVLSFKKFLEFDMLPDSIGELIHLRYLDLSRTGIKTLPDSLGNLYNLQTLKLYGCYALTMLPSAMQNLVNLRHLDIRGTSIEEMPPRMGKLKHLRILSYFVVGQHEENRIKELGELTNIQGSLTLRKLENVANSDEAKEARMKDKTHINDLTLEWSRDSGEIVTTSTHLEREILDELQPHKGMKVLSIGGYRGTRFSDWVGHSSYDNMTHVSLWSCDNCCMLPSLGQLPQLKRLSISRLNAVERVGDKFYKNDDDVCSLETPFPCLQKLFFEEMSCWELWCSYESFVFTQLQTLEIRNCPKLKGDLPSNFPALKELYIRDCPNLIDLPKQLPALETLEIVKCGQLVSSLLFGPAFRNLTIQDSNSVGLQEFPISLQSLDIKGCQLVKPMLGIITSTQPTCLQSLKISSCSCVLSFSSNCLPNCVKKLVVRNCENLELPSQHEYLESLQIYGSRVSVTSFLLDGFPNLKSLTLGECRGLQTLTVSLLHLKLSALDYLRVFRCPDFEGFPTKGLVAPNLTNLRLNNCPMLKSLPSRMNTLLPKLHRLEIVDCPQIDAFPEGGLPPNLKTLRIMECGNLLRSVSLIGVHKGLTDLTIDDASIESDNSFPWEGFLPQLPSLHSLQLFRFKNIETLDCSSGLLHLTSLQVLSIRDCPKLKNMVGERLPPSLIKLEIRESPLLGEQCEKKHPQIWHKISDIPGIQVDWRYV